jgi:hypothetical protein
MSSFLVNKRGCSACPDSASSPRKVSDYGLPRNGKARLKGAQLDGVKIAKKLKKDTVGEILNPGALKAKWKQSKNHKKENRLVIKALQTARYNKDLETEKERMDKSFKGKFKMPRFIAVPSTDLVPNTIQRDDDRKIYQDQRDEEIKQANALKNQQQRTDSETLALNTEQRNQVVSSLTKRRKPKIPTKEVVLGHSKVIIPTIKVAVSHAYQAPSTKGPRGKEYSVRGRNDSKTLIRPQTAPTKRIRSKLKAHQKVPCWWADQASAWEILHIGERGC